MDTTKKQVMRGLQICKEWEELRVTPPSPEDQRRITLNTGTGRKEEYYLLKTASQEVEVMEVPKLLMWRTLLLVTSTDQVIGPNSSLWEGLLKSLSHPVHRMNVTKSGKWVWKIIPCVTVQQYWAIWGFFWVSLRPRARMPTPRVSLFTCLSRQSDKCPQLTFRSVSSHYQV